MARVRYFREQNYGAIFDGKNTIRLNIGGEITKPPYAEMFDIALNNQCFANCSYCYVSALKSGKNFSNVVGKIKEYFGSMSLNQRPFQVALGGHGEPTLHPDFIEVFKTFRELKIVPNYTTNGMHLSKDILEATKKYAGGVAVSAHPHLKWYDAVKKLADYTEVHLHVIVSDKASIARFFDIHSKYSDLVTTFVLLPYQAVGRAIEKETNFEYLLDELENRNYKNVAYGAYLHKYLKNRPKLNVSLYEPHMFSKYLILDDPVTEYTSSYDTGSYTPSV